MEFGMQIKNGKVFNKDYIFEDTDIEIIGDRIVKISKFLSDASKDSEIIDATNCYVIPGLVDIHVHGCMGYDFCDGTCEAIQKITEYELLNGITSICATSMTYDESTLSEVYHLISENKSRYGAEIIGINMEGPFISKEYKGSQNENYIISPDISMFNRLQNEADGLIKLVSIAPEIPGAMDFIMKLSSVVHISLAHTCADYGMAIDAFNAGADHVTHLYNGMKSFHHRNPGIPGAVSDTPNVFTELICDGIHCDESTMRMTLKVLGTDRLIFISDSVSSCGMDDGEYSLGGQRIILKDKIARLEDGTIAGASTNLMDNMIKIVKEYRIPLETAVKCASVNPAKSIGLFNEFGSIEPNKRANIVILDKNYNIISVIHNGRVIAQKKEKY